MFGKTERKKMVVPLLQRGRAQNRSKIRYKKQQPFNPVTIVIGIKPKTFGKALMQVRQLKSVHSRSVSRFIQ